jgi:anaerobic magnesium-protoporphyrin IX monomethyl ester cyclase
MTDVLLVQPPIRDFYLTAKRTIPYGLAGDRGRPADLQGFSVEILDGLARPKVPALPLPPELNHLQAYYGRPDASPFALFHRFRHFGFSFEHLARRVARAAAAPLVGISALCTPYAEEALATAAAIKALHPERPHRDGRPPRDPPAARACSIPGGGFRAARGGRGLPAACWPAASRSGG